MKFFAPFPLAFALLFCIFTITPLHASFITKPATMPDGETIHEEGNPASGGHTHKTTNGEISHSHQ
ncbi:MAG: hypothetical protein OSB05_00760 [Akkermansiaceae bacterium]|nr:hypothetical protein [Akkermansiaceae bacterium]